MQIERFYSVSELSALTGIRENTWYKWLAGGIVTRTKV